MPPSRAYRVSNELDEAPQHVAANRSALRYDDRYRSPRRHRADEPTQRRHRDWDERRDEPTERRYRRIDPD
jgi:hypothetical protein